MSVHSSRHLPPLWKGWEEICDLNLDHMLKAALVQKGVQKEPFIGNGGNPLKMPLDLNKLKKRVTTVIDRLANGVRFIADGEEDEA